MPFLAKNRGELIHDAAFDAAIVVFGGLADARQFEPVDAAPEQLVQGKSIDRLQSGRRRHAGTQGHIARENGVETADLPAAFLHFAAHAEQIASPRLHWLVRFIQPENGLLAQVERKGPHAVGAVGADGRHDSLVHSAREDEPAIIVDVLANKVDAARRNEQRSARPVNRSEFLSNCLGFYHIGLSVQTRAAKSAGTNN